MIRRLTRLAAVVTLTALAATAPAKAELQDIIDSGKVRIGVPIDVPPFGFMDEQNQPAGIDVEVARMVAEALGVELELQSITSANRIPYLVTDRIDLVISAMGATPERATQIAFSSPYSALSLGVFGWPEEVRYGKKGGRT